MTTKNELFDDEGFALFLLGIGFLVGLGVTAVVLSVKILLDCGVKS